MFKNLHRRFWSWYERHYTVNIAIAGTLFALQVVHLAWLTFDVVFAKLGMSPLLNIEGTSRLLIVLVDYTEIPSLIGVSILYVHHLRQKFAWKEVMYLIFLNVQWIHLFWITDEFVVSTLATDTIMSGTLAWIAIFIDYLELPVIIDVIKKNVVLARRNKKNIIKLVTNKFSS